MAARKPNQDTGVYLEPFGQEPAFDTTGWEYEPGTYGQEWYNRPPINVSRDWKLDIPKLNALGFQFIAKIGSGEFGEVWRVTHTDANGQDRQLAAKILLTKSLFYSLLKLKDIIKHMLTEVTALRGLQHPSLVSVESVAHIRDESTGYPSLFIVIFMELCDGSLADLVKHSPNGCFDEHQALDWFIQIADGMLYLHQHHVAHQDIKPENILYKRVPGSNIIQYKLADFGLAKVFGPDQPMKSRDYGGTIHYLPPEICQFGTIYLPFIYQRPIADLKAMDVYALALSLAESLIGYAVDRSRYVRRISLTPGLDFDYWVYDLLIRSGKFADNHPVIDLLSRMTESDPNQRLTMDQVLLRPWLTRPSRPH